jgi:hypothetical protein
LPVFRDRVKDSSTSTGTGAFTLSGTAPTSFQSFNTAFGLNSVFTYCIADATSGLWETGAGYLTTSTNMVRAQAFSGSSGAGVFVTFTAGTKDVFCTIAAHWAEDVDTGAMVARMNGLALP